LRAAVFCWVFVSCGLGIAQSASGDPFYMGADISLETFMQQQNVPFSDSIGQAPLDSILYDHGANLFRLRIFVNPQTAYTNTNVGAIQDQAYDIALAQQIKAHAPNAKILLDFMYSDTWADPGAQAKPAAWTNIPLSDPINHNDLLTKVQSYTQNTLQAFGAAGVMPDMVQVGNEISSGMLFGTGSGANAQGGRLSFSGSGQQASWQNLGALLNSAILGVRAAQGTGPKIDVAIHIDQGDQGGHTQFYFNNLTNPTWGNVNDFDVIGVSYYPSTRSNHSLALLQSSLNASADAYPTKKIMVLETNYSWEPTPSFTDVGVPQWTESPAGQQQFLADLQNVMLNLHNNAGEGIVYWYPEAVHLPNFSTYHDGATALFDNSKSALPALDTFGITLIPGDVNVDRVVDQNDYNTILNNIDGQLGARRINGDLNGDGVVDLFDFAEWKNLFVGAAGAGAAGGQAAAPEPCSFMLLAWAGAYLVWLRKKW
jgi:arabinogalactan endo-1,4-beta-galactosidase